MSPDTNPCHLVLTNVTWYTCTLWTLLIVCLCTVFIGRKLLDIWMPDTKVHELYTGACGLYVCWLILRAVVIIGQWVPLGWRNLVQRLKDWIIVVSTQDSQVLLHSTKVDRVIHVV